MESGAGACAVFRLVALIALLPLIVLIETGCGGGDGSVYSDSHPTVNIIAFSVTGNDTPVNGREQIVAGINNGTFSLGVNIETIYSDEARVWVSDQEDLAATDHEMEIAHVACGYYPFCSFGFTVNCSFSVANRVTCSMGGGGSGPIQADFPVADITPLLGADRTELFLVLVGSAHGSNSAQRSLPVTFRYN